MDSRRPGGAPARPVVAGASVRTGSVADIEALPGEGQEQVLEAGTGHGELLDADAALDERRDDLLRRDAVRRPADPAGHRLDAAEAELRT